MRHREAFWSGKCVVITGASSGIGQTLAERLAKRGAKVGLLARRVERLAQIAEGIRAAGGSCAYAPADVTDATGLAAAVRQIEASLGPCDVMIANAGIYRKTDVRRFDAAAADSVIAVNLQGVIHAFAAVLPDMVARRAGRLVAVSSIAGMLGLPGAAAYCASKAAVTTLLASLRVDLYPLGVRVTAVCPGFVDTPMITDEERAARKDILTPADAADRICRAVERGRAEAWFPRGTWWMARLARALPPTIYRWVMARVPDMDETSG
jgi:short-subunit dehydrogenase